mmetsp:Transcript_21754/g.45910  ORF Transcript_21754/g.45910 Transcript_21754/m.45910 type:complete len:87 (+) Transcript_21754:449-709(+)
MGTMSLVPDGLRFFDPLRTAMLNTRRNGMVDWSVNVGDALPIWDMCFWMVLVQKKFQKLFSNLPLLRIPEDGKPHIFRDFVLTEHR